ncbi:MAG: AraC family transcriptional regulator [Spirochaetota bacterium]
MDDLARFGIDLLRIGTRHSPEKKTFDEFGRRTVGHFVIAYLAAGEGRFASAGGLVPVKKGDLIICSPEQWHQYGPERGALWSEYWLTADGPLVEQFRISGIFDAQRPVIHIGTAKGIVADWERCLMLMEKNGDRAERAAAVGSLLLRIAALADRAEISDRKRALIERIVRTMRVHVRERRFDIRAHAGEFGYSYTRKLFKRYTGHAPDEYFRMIKIAAARERLIHTDEKVHAVAERFGFRDQYYFARLFRKMEGVSPRGYRNTYAR